MVNADIERNTMKLKSDILSQLLSIVLHLEVGLLHVRVLEHPRAQHRVLEEEGGVPCEEGEARVGSARTEPACVCVDSRQQTRARHVQSVLAVRELHDRLVARVAHRPVVRHRYRLKLLYDAPLKVSRGARLAGRVHQTLCHSVTVLQCIAL